MNAAAEHTVKRLLCYYIFLKFLFHCLCKMKNTQTWDWNTGKKCLADVSAWKNKFSVVQELRVSHDGEKVAALVEINPGKVTPCINGNTWEETYEKVWSLKFTPQDHLACAVLKDYEWTVAVDGVPWEETYDFVWNMSFGQGGSPIAVNVKKDNEHGVSINGRSWKHTFVEVRDLVLSPDGKRAATRIKTKRVATLDISGFAGKVLTIAVDEIPWEQNYLGIWGFTFDSYSRRIAAGVKLDHLAFTVAVDGSPWTETFLGVWEPGFRPGSANASAPVKTPEGWTLAENGAPIWPQRFVQLWGQRYSSDGKRIAAVSAPVFGKWTVCVDGSPWKKTFSEAVLPPSFSPDTTRVASVAKDSGSYTMVVDGVVWEGGYEMMWDPVFSPDSAMVAAKAEIHGKYILVVNGAPGKHVFDELWDPVFSPDGNRVLIRGIEDGKFYRKVVPIDDI